MNIQIQGQTLYKYLYTITIISLNATNLNWDLSSPPIKFSMNHLYPEGKGKTTQNYHGFDHLVKKNHNIRQARKMGFKGKPG